jgi:exosortase family protein XrtF
MILRLFRENSAFRFISVFLILIILWMMLYHWVINPWGWLDKLVINDSSLWSVYFLEMLGYPTFVGNNPTIRTIGIDGTHGLWIGDPCDGLTIFALFAFFIIAYPGKWKHKAWFIPAGITLIHFMNILRITILCIIVKTHPSWLEFNHTYLFQILMYLFIFCLWFIWIKRFSGVSLLPKKTSE